MTGRLRISHTGLELIKSFEGFRDTALRLPDGLLARWVRTCALGAQGVHDL